MKFGKGVTLLIGAGILIASVVACDSNEHGGHALRWTAIRADAAGFGRAPVILTSGDESVLVDGGFTLSDGKAVADRIASIGKPLTSVFVSASDPDYYFGLRPITERFPDAKVIAPEDVVAAIHGSVAGKIATWSPQLGDNGPRAVADVVAPHPTAQQTLTVGGHSIDIVRADNLGDHYYLWSPDLDAIFGGNLVFSGEHLFIADLPGLAQRQQWITTLDTMLGRNPKIVVAGHAAAGIDNGIAALRFTRDYLTAFDDADAHTSDSAALIAAMRQRYPGLPGDSNLELSAKVVKGEMRWG
ncbi:MBL fold metallo-hydrolase [Nocardia pseudobrasiliensis]|uniref:Glyoxylase-like metal-dependent hydrolase (Beta-lactamase superfamily II) n=1 Tax=Nocardia pseudobrasiliensis TaxID=45979 RepID=A0A370I468_9NOCA|nr:MBL fold metallo-hydrolase [Nocardia pseudobrasiliensis]RDI65526.1 glyoxylase-like metal-dependent hydrolase (beta-lactamase superfamily II) [Nocardia pseudobrasiliensis]